MFLKKKAAPRGRLFHVGKFARGQSCLGVSFFLNVRGLEPLWSLGDFKRDALTLFERFESLLHDGRMMDEHIVAVLLRDESITL